MDYGLVDATYLGFLIWFSGFEVGIDLELAGYLVLFPLGCEWEFPF